VRHSNFAGLYAALGSFPRAGRNRTNCDGHHIPLSWGMAFALGKASGMASRPRTPRVIPNTLSRKSGPASAGFFL